VLDVYQRGRRGRIRRGDDSRRCVAERQPLGDGPFEVAGYLAGAGMAVVSIDYRLAPPRRIRIRSRIAWTHTTGRSSMPRNRGGPEPRRPLGDSPATSRAAARNLANESRVLRARAHAPAVRACVESLRSTRRRICCVCIAANEIRWNHGTELRRRRPDDDPVRWKEVSPIENVHRDLPPILILQEPATCSFRTHRPRALPNSSRLPAQRTSCTSSRTGCTDSTVSTRVPGRLR